MKRQDPHQQLQQGGTLLTALLVVAALMPWPLLLDHDKGLAFALVSAAIVGALRLLLGREWTGRAGLKLPSRDIVLVVLAFAMVATGSKLLLPIVYKAAGLKANAPNIEDQIGFLFQAFNEEVLFRALMIGLVLHYVRSPVLVSLGLALLFPVAHFVLYRYSNPMHLALSINALTTLFFAGVAMNALYLTFRHIGFSWALHAGWNVVWLPATIYDAASHARLYEPQVFDRVLGSPILVAMVGAVAAFCFATMLRYSIASEC